MGLQLSSRTHTQALLQGWSCGTGDGGGCSTDALLLLLALLLPHCQGTWALCAFASCKMGLLRRKVRGIV